MYKIIRPLDVTTVADMFNIALTSGEINAVLDAYDALTDVEKESVPYEVALFTIITEKFERTHGIDELQVGTEYFLDRLRKDTGIFKGFSEHGRCLMFKPVISSGDYEVEPDGNVYLLEEGLRNIYFTTKKNLK